MEINGIKYRLLKDTKVEKMCEACVFGSSEGMCKNDAANKLCGTGDSYFVCESQKAETGEKQCNLPIVTAPLLWSDVLDDFYVEYDKEISNGEFAGKMILVFRDWLDKNYKVPERNGR